VRGLLAHGAGLIGLDRPMTMPEIGDDQVLPGLLARAKPRLVDHGVGDLHLARVPGARLGVTPVQFDALRAESARTGSFST
jgi:hypothetical protein